jgi:hypothetical protein
MAFSDIFVTGSDGKRVLDDTGCPILKDHPSTFFRTVVIDGKSYDIYLGDVSEYWPPESYQDWFNDVSKD